MLFTSDGSRLTKAEADHLIAIATLEADKHKPDERRGGCTCGFCAWSVDHVLVMSMRHALGHPL